jgi:hypothetical protein
MGTAKPNHLHMPKQKTHLVIRLDSKLNQKLPVKVV